MYLKIKKRDLTVVSKLNYKLFLLATKQATFHRSKIQQDLLQEFHIPHVEMNKYY